MFAQGLNIELKDKIDVMVLECGLVDTKLNIGPKGVSTEVATKTSLNNLGFSASTYGWPLNEFFARVIMTPMFLKKPEFRNAFKKAFKER